MNNVPYTLTDTAVSIVLNFSPKVIPASHPNFGKIVDLLHDGATEDQIEPLIDLPKAISSTAGGFITVEKGKLFFKGFEVKNTLSNLILQLLGEGRDTAANPLKSFLENCYENPDRRAVDDLYDWCAHSGLPITPDGCILAWKAVRDDYRSIHTPNDARFDHRVGKVVEERREDCDADPDRPCSSGLHFCSGAYLKNYTSGGSRVVAVKINPRDVVAFPKDYGWEKGRACRYEVVGEVPSTEVAGFYPQGKRVFGGWGSTSDSRMAGIVSAGLTR